MFGSGKEDAKPAKSGKVAFDAQSLMAVKHALYIVVALFSFILFVVSCVVVPYERDTYGGYNPPAAELGFTGGVGTVFLPLFVWAQRVRPDFMFNSVAADLGFCMFMWLFLLGGVAALTDQTYDLPGCQTLFICRGFSTMMAFAWMSWILITLVIFFFLYLIGKLWSSKQSIKWLAPSKDLCDAAKKDLTEPENKASSQEVTSESENPNPGK